MAGAPYEWLIGTRYLRSTHRRGFVSFVALMSVCGLTLGVATLIVVLSVMNGFERELRTRILAVTSHATLTGVSGTLADWQTLAQRARRQSGVQAAVPYVESQAMLANGYAMAGAAVRGVLPDEERTATGLARRVTAGSLDDLTPGGFRIILGSALAHELGARLGGTVVVIAPQGTATPTRVGAPQPPEQEVGIFF
jgi:lipoprotein-releasing system permease protein